MSAPFVYWVTVSIALLFVISVSRTHWLYGIGAVNANGACRIKVISVILTTKLPVFDCILQCAFMFLRDRLYRACQAVFHAVPISRILPSEGLHAHVSLNHKP